MTWTRVRDKTIFLAVTTAPRLYRSEDGTSWEDVSPEGFLWVGTPDGGYRTDDRLAVLADGSVFARAWGRVVRSRDGGRTWAEMLANWDYPRVGTFGYRWERRASLLAASRHANVVWVVPWRDATIWRSGDGGDTWEAILSDLDDPARVTSVVAAGDGTLYAVAADDAAGPEREWDQPAFPMRSLDGGRTWKPLGGSAARTEFTSFWEDARDPHVIWGEASGAVYRSSDRGEHWGRAFTMPEPPGPGQGTGVASSSRRLTVITSAADPKTMYAREAHWLWTSRDGGRSWQKRDIPYGLLMASPDGRDTLVAAAQRGGLMRSDDAGLTWQVAHRGIAAPTPFAFSVSHPKGRVLAWLEGGRARYCIDGRTWRDAEVPSGSKRDDGWAVVPHDATRIYWLGRWVRSEDGGQSWTPWQPGPLLASMRSPCRIVFGPTADSPAWAMEEVTEGPEHEQVLAVSDDLIRWRRVSPPSGLLWAAGAGAPGSLYLSLSRSSAPDGSGEQTRHLFVTEDRGRTWRELVPRRGRPPSRDRPSGYKMEVFPGAPTRLIVFPGYGVYVSPDNGKTWLEVSQPMRRGSIVGTGLSDCVREPAGRRVWLAVDGGIIEARDAGGTWRDLTGDLPQTTGTMLAYDGQEGYLYAATGAGLYRLKVGK